MWRVIVIIVDVVVSQPTENPWKRTVVKSNTTDGMCLAVAYHLIPHTHTHRLHCLYIRPLAHKPTTIYICNKVQRQEV